MLTAGFVPGRDLRAAILGQGRDAPTDFSYRHEPLLDAYGDCRLHPLGCDRERASALRTFSFGMLETVLGYNGGELGRRRYADAVANLALRTQIGSDGVVRAADRVAYRPALRGGFLIQPEYLGLRPTDSETGFDAYAFLALSRCARYQVGCKLVGSASPTLTP